MNCTAKNNKGKKCQRKCIEGKQYCWQHKKNICPTFYKIREKCHNKTWSLLNKKKIGQGSFGDIYTVCRADNQKKCEYALKVQRADDSFFTEVKILNKLLNTNIVPKIYAAWVCKNLGYIVEDKLFPLSEKTTNKLFKQVKDKLKLLHDYKIVHLDPQRTNIMMDKNKNIKFVDFGTSMDFSEIPNNTIKIYSLHLEGPINFLEAKKYDYGRLIQTWSGLQKDKEKGRKIMNKIENNIEKSKNIQIEPDTFEIFPF